MYRLCLASKTLDEDCFNQIKLPFATPDKHMLRYADSRLDHAVNATMVTEGGGAGWMLYPWPSGNVGGDCMYSVTGTGRHCFYKNNTRDAGPGHVPVPGRAYCNGCGAPTYLSDGACPCLGLETCPEVPLDAGSDLAFTPDPDPHHPSSAYALEDGLVVPSEIPAGEYVLNYRWDAEMTSQIWQSCSDITIE